MDPDEMINYMRVRGLINESDILDIKEYNKNFVYKDITEIDPCLDPNFIVDIFNPGLYGGPTPYSRLWENLSNNFFIDINFLKKYRDKPFDKFMVSKSPCITFKDILNNKEFFDRQSVMSNPNITFKDLNHPYFAGLCKTDYQSNPNMNVRILEKTGYPISDKAFNIVPSWSVDALIANDGFLLYKDIIKNKRDQFPFIRRIKKFNEIVLMHLTDLPEDLIKEIIDY